MRNSITLENVEIEDYKSINKIKLKFDRDLNILIGQNGVGKSNILNSIYHLLNFDLSNINNMAGKVEFTNYKGDKIKLKIQNKLNKKDSRNLSLFVKNNETIQGSVNQQRLSKISQGKDFTTFKRKNGLLLSPILIKHGVPKNYPLVSKPLSYSFKLDNFSEDLIEIITDYNTPYFVRTLCVELFQIKHIQSSDYAKKIKTLRKRILDVFDRFLGFKNSLTQYTNIEDVRLNADFNFQYDSVKGIVYINNLVLEFKINKQWLKFDNLSDGSKRLFYIISEIGYESNVNPNSEGFTSGSYSGSKIILLEEPELGLHPHQIRKLLEFINEFRDDYQFIITTHSPEALDILNKEELDKLFVISQEEGSTKVRKLTRIQISKAKSYMEDEFLSDYWKYSDLEG